MWSTTVDVKPQRRNCASFQLINDKDNCNSSHLYSHVWVCSIMNTFASWNLKIVVHIYTFEALKKVYVIDQSNTGNCIRNLVPVMLVIVIYE